MIIQKDIHEMSEEYFFDNIYKKPIILTGIIEQWKIHNFDLEIWRVVWQQNCTSKRIEKDDFKEFME